MIKLFDNSLHYQHYSAGFTVDHVNSFRNLELFSRHIIHHLLLHYIYSDRCARNSRKAERVGRIQMLPYADSVNGLINMMWIMCHLLHTHLSLTQLNTNRRLCRMELIKTANEETYFGKMVFIPSVDSNTLGESLRRSGVAVVGKKNLRKETFCWLLAMLAAVGLLVHNQI